MGWPEEKVLKLNHNKRFWLFILAGLGLLVLVPKYVQPFFSQPEVATPQRILPLSHAPSSKPEALTSRDPIRYVQQSPAKDVVTVRRESELEFDHIGTQVAAFNRAVAQHDFESAQKQLDLIIRQVGVNSLLAVKLKAYLALQQDQRQLARQLYEHIAEISDTPEASVNLALLDWRDGRTEQARQRLQKLALTHRQDPHVQQALVAMDIGQ
ncbi:MAG: hypothetical protein RQ715_07025 [Methylococcales bacterium]|nr:hypothetical protein [Methylococcales bacterium]